MCACMCAWTCAVCLWVELRVPAWGLNQICMLFHRFGFRKKKEMHLFLLLSGVKKCTFSLGNPKTWVENLCIFFFSPSLSLQVSGKLLCTSTLPVERLALMDELLDSSTVKEGGGGGGGVVGVRGMHEDVCVWIIIMPPVSGVLAICVQVVVHTLHVCWCPHVLVLPASPHHCVALWMWRNGQVLGHTTCVFLLLPRWF